MSTSILQTPLTRCLWSGVTCARSLARAVFPKHAQSHRIGPWCVFSEMREGDIAFSLWSRFWLHAQLPPLAGWTMIRALTDATHPQTYIMRTTLIGRVPEWPSETHRCTFTITIIAISKSQSLNLNQHRQSLNQPMWWLGLRHYYYSTSLYWIIQSWKLVSDNQHW